MRCWAFVEISFENTVTLPSKQNISVSMHIGGPGTHRSQSRCKVLVVIVCVGEKARVCEVIVAIKISIIRGIIDKVVICPENIYWCVVGHFGVIIVMGGMANSRY